MTFLYVDESGAQEHSDVFVMCGVMVDATKLRIRTHESREKIGAMLDRHPATRSELKTSSFINGKDKWASVCADDRKRLLREICTDAVRLGGKVFAIGLSLTRYADMNSRGAAAHFEKHHWLAAAMFIIGMVQKKMQNQRNNKGHTVVVVDDHKKYMSRLPEEMHAARNWYDGLYRKRQKRGGRSVWAKRTSTDRFNQIINTPFAIKSEHAPLVQVADAVAYVYRRWLELHDGQQKWDGEREYYNDLVDGLEKGRQKLGQVPKDAECVAFYRALAHERWEL